MIPTAITEHWLRDNHACWKQTLAFRNTFSITGDDQEVPITLDNLLIAARNGIYVGWLGKAIFGYKGTNEVHVRTLEEQMDYYMTSSGTPEESASLIRLYVACANVFWDLYQKEMKKDLYQRGIQVE